MRLGALRGFPDLGPISLLARDEPTAGDAMRAISRRLADASIADRAEIACIGRERADLVVAGCAILESIIDLWPAARVGVADRGIREGILRTLAMQGRDSPVTRREFRK